MHVPAFVLANFFLILRTVQRSGLPSGVVCIVLRNVITYVRCEISFLILRTVPRNVAKVTRPSPCGVWSGHETTQRCVENYNIAILLNCHSVV